MSKTISFVASDELAEYLEKEADRRMTTISSTAQQMLAEYVRMSDPSHSVETEGRKTDVERMQEIREGALDPAQDDGADDPFQRHPDKWYEPNSDKHDYAVDVPADAGIYDAGETRYFKTRTGAAKALRRWYE